MPTKTRRRTRLDLELELLRTHRELDDVRRSLSLALAKVEAVKPGQELDAWAALGWAEGALAKSVGQLDSLLGDGSTVLEPGPAERR